MSLAKADLGETFFGIRIPDPSAPASTASLARRFRSCKDKEPYAPLTKKQWEVVLLVRDGLTDVQIGRRLRISHTSVRTHLHEVRARLGITNRVTLAVWVERTERRAAEPIRRDLQALTVDLSERLTWAATDVECLSLAIRFLVEIRRAMEKHAQKESAVSSDAR